MSLLVGVSSKPDLTCVLCHSVIRPLTWQTACVVEVGIAAEDVEVPSDLNFPSDYGGVRNFLRFFSHTLSAQVAWSVALTQKSSFPVYSKGVVCRVSRGRCLILPQYVFPTARPRPYYEVP
jgi:hypothetical protein